MLNAANISFTCMYIQKCHIFTCVCHKCSVVKELRYQINIFHETLAAMSCKMAVIMCSYLQNRIFFKYFTCRNLFFTKLECFQVAASKNDISLNRLNWF